MGEGTPGSVFQSLLLILLLPHWYLDGTVASNAGLLSDLEQVQLLLRACAPLAPNPVPVNCATPSLLCACVAANTSTVQDGCAAGTELRVVGLSVTVAPTASSGAGLPDGIGQLNALSTFVASGCQFRGSLPASIARLTSLTSLDLSSNQLTGSIPPWLGSLPLLRQINLSNNAFSGNLSTALCTLGPGASLSVTNNPALTGRVPTCLVSPPPAILSDIQGTALTWPAPGMPSPGFRPPGTIAPPTQDSSSTANLNKTLAWALPLTAVCCLLVGAACTAFLVSRRLRQQKKQERRRQQEHKQLKQLMHALADMGGTGRAGGPLGRGMNSQPSVLASTTALTAERLPSSIMNAHSGLALAPSMRDTGQIAWASGKAFAFVVTDIEGSTQISSAAGPSLFAKLQEIHDNVMREMIAKHGGLEITTEGDSFTVAFTSVAPAVAFCMDVQYKLLDVAWPPSCLKLNPCRVITGPQGQLIFAGLRVRMGVHWAQEGSVAHRLHQLTKQRVFEGPGLQTAQEVGDTAHGGQVLLSQDAWVALRVNMAAAGFPVIRCLGMYQLETLAAPTWLYHATEVVGKPLGRSFGAPRGVRQLWSPAFALPPAPPTAPASQPPQLPQPPQPPQQLESRASVPASVALGMPSLSDIPPHLRALTLPSLLTSVVSIEARTPTQTTINVPSGGAPRPLPATWELRCLPPPGLQTLASPDPQPLTFVMARLECPSSRRDRKTPVSLATTLEEVLAIQAQQFRGYLMDSYQSPTVTSGQPPDIGAVPHAPSGAGGAHAWASVPPRMLGLALSALTPRSAAQNAAFAQSTSTWSLGTGGWGAVPWDSWCVVFEFATDALRFCHAAQMALMYTRFPTEASAWIGDEVLGSDGRALFQGPRVAMALHTTSEYDVTVQPAAQPVPELCVSYSGAGMAFATALSSCVHGGQVVLSESAWEQVKPTMVSHPGALVALSLGSHIVAPSWPTPQHLMEVMPNLLARRGFPPLTTHTQTQPGYRDAPGTNKPLTIVFVKVQKPAAVVRAQQQGCNGAPRDMSDEEVLSTIVAYQLAVNSYVTVARQLLSAYGGYECKEPEPGKFTLAFQHLEMAIAWSAQLQRELLNVRWPAAVLSWPDCAQEWSQEDGRLLWSGLRIRIGMAHGFIGSKKPLNTGRADYFGVLANTAARVCALAAPGQVLVECCDGKAQPLVGDGQPLLRETAVTSLGVRWAPIAHGPDPTHSATASPVRPSQPPQRADTAASAAAPPPRAPSDPSGERLPQSITSAPKSVADRRPRSSAGGGPAEPGDDSTAVSGVTSVSQKPPRAATGTQPPTRGISAVYSGGDGAGDTAVYPSTGSRQYNLVGGGLSAGGISSTYGDATQTGGALRQSNSGLQNAAPSADVPASVGTAVYQTASAAEELASSATQLTQPHTTTLSSHTQSHLQSHLGSTTHTSQSTQQLPQQLQTLQPSMAVDHATMQGVLAGILPVAVAPPPGSTQAESAAVTTPPAANGQGMAPQTADSKAIVHIEAEQAPEAIDDEALDDEVWLRPLGWFLLRGLHSPKLIFQATPMSLSGRVFPPPAGPLASTIGADGGRAPSITGSASVVTAISQSNSRVALQAMRSVLGRALGGPAVLTRARSNSTLSAAGGVEGRGETLFTDRASAPGQVWPPAVAAAADAAAAAAVAGVTVTRVDERWGSGSATGGNGITYSRIRADLTTTSGQQQSHVSLESGWGAFSHGHSVPTRMLRSFDQSSYKPADATGARAASIGSPGVRSRASSYLMPAMAAAPAQSESGASDTRSRLRVFARRALHAASSLMRTNSEQQSVEQAVGYQTTPNAWRPAEAAGSHGTSAYSGAQQARNLRGAASEPPASLTSFSVLQSAMLAACVPQPASPYTLPGQHASQHLPHLPSAEAVAAAAAMAAAHGFPSRKPRKIRVSSSAWPSSQSARYPSSRLGSNSSGTGAHMAYAHPVPQRSSRESVHSEKLSKRVSIVDEQPEHEQAEVGRGTAGPSGSASGTDGGAADSARIGTVDASANGRYSTPTSAARTAVGTPVAGGAAASAAEQSDASLAGAAQAAPSAHSSPPHQPRSIVSGDVSHASYRVHRDEIRSIGPAGTPRAPPSEAGATSEYSALSVPRQDEAYREAQSSRAAGDAASATHAAGDSAGTSPLGAAPERMHSPRFNYNPLGRNSPRADDDTPSAFSSASTSFSSPLPTEHQPQPSPGQHEILDYAPSSGTGSPSPEGPSRMHYGLLHQPAHSPTHSGTGSVFRRLLSKPASILNGSGSQSRSGLQEAPSAGRAAVNLMQRLLLPQRSIGAAAASAGDAADAMEAGAGSGSAAASPMHYEGLSRGVLPSDRTRRTALVGSAGGAGSPSYNSGGGGGGSIWYSGGENAVDGPGGAGGSAAQLWVVPRSASHASTAHRSDSGVPTPVGAAGFDAAHRRFSGLTATSGGGGGASFTHIPRPPSSSLLPDGPLAVAPRIVSYTSHASSSSVVVAGGSGLPRRDSRGALSQTESGMVGAAGVSTETSSHRSQQRAYAAEVAATYLAGRSQLKQTSSVAQALAVELARDSQDSQSLGPCNIPSPSTLATALSLRSRLNLPSGAPTATTPQPSAGPAAGSAFAAEPATAAATGRNSGPVAVDAYRTAVASGDVQLSPLQGQASDQQQPSSSSRRMSAASSHAQSHGPQ